MLVNKRATGSSSYFFSEIRDLGLDTDHRLSCCGLSVARAAAFLQHMPNSKFINLNCSGFDCTS